MQTEARAGRELIYNPVYHDWGDLPGVARRAIYSNPQKAVYYDQFLEILWNSIYRGFSEFRQDYKGVKLFNEGTIEDLGPLEDWSPFDTMRRSIESLGVERIFKKRQTGLGIALRFAGANEIATEDEQLLIEASNLIVMLTRATASMGETGTYNRELVNFNYHFRENAKKRDVFIANSINKGLNTGEQGILILGAGHLILPKLNPDINVRFISPEIERFYTQELNDSYTKVEEMIKIMQEGLPA